MDGTRFKLIMIVCDDCTCHFANFNTGNILWSHNMGPPNIYNAHQNEAKQYIDAHLHQNGSIKVFHFKCFNGNNNKKKKEIREEQLGEYVQRMDGVAYNYCEDFVNLDTEKGTHVDVGDISSSYIHIKRIRHMMTSCKWYLDFSRFEVEFCDTYGNRVPLEVKVRLTNTRNEVDDLCEGINNLQFSSGVTLEEASSPYQPRMTNRIWMEEDPMMLIDGINPMVTGFYDGYLASIVLMNHDIGISNIHNLLLLSNSSNHNNIARYLGFDMDNNGRTLFAFEYCDITLASFVDSYMETLNYQQTLLGCLRGLCLGVEELHKLGLAHGNIDKENVLLTVDYSVPKLYGLVNCRRSTDDQELLDRDYVDLGNVLLYCCSHPFPNVLSDELRDVLTLLSRGSLEVDLRQIVAHPLLWDAEKRIQFIKTVSDLIEVGTIDRQTIENIPLRRTWWGNHFHSQVKGIMRKHRIYQYDSVCDLLRFMRNAHSHMFEIINEFNNTRSLNHLGATSDFELESVFRAASPDLLIKVYHALENDPVLQNANLSRYYC